MAVAVAVCAAGVPALVAAPRASGISPEPHCGEPSFFGSPYIGHTGSFNGAGGDAANPVRTNELEEEASEGLHWTFNPVYWAKMQPNGPNDGPSNDPGGVWQELDSYVVAAHHYGLNPLLQIDVGGNAGGPPSWAGERVSGSSAPTDMAALVHFAGMLVSRYMPGGALARAEGWGTCFGVRAWEMDNEPSSYETNWSGEAGDYAQFVDETGRLVHSIDPRALVVAPALADGQAAAGSDQWLSGILDPYTTDASPAYLASGQHHSAGPQTDVVSFHVYEGVTDRPFIADPRVQTAYAQIEGVLNDPANTRRRGFAYAPKTEFWCTECSADYAVTQYVPGASPEDPYANWVDQYMTRAFGSGVGKLTIQDPSAEEQQAVRVYASVLPQPAGITDVTSALGYSRSAVRIFRWEASPGGSPGGSRPSSVGPRPSSVGPRPSSVGPRPPSAGPRPPSAGPRPSSVGPRPSEWVYVAWVPPECQDPFGATCDPVSPSLPQTVSLPVRSLHPVELTELGARTTLTATRGRAAVSLGIGADWNPVTIVVDQ